MEIWDLVDENKNLIGKTIERGAVPDGVFHIVVHVWIKNSKNEYLIAKRAANRSAYPLKDECVGGSVLAGETSAKAALREVHEEVGLIFEEQEAKLVKSFVRKTIGEKHFNDIVDVWLIHYDGEVDLKNATTDEVDSIKWCDVDDIQKLFDSGEFVPTMNYFFELHKKLQKEQVNNKKIKKNKQKKKIASEKDKYFAFYDDIKVGSHKVVDW